MDSHSTCWARLLVICAVLAAATAYPELYLSEVANGCTDHPTKDYGAHGPPQVDKTVTFAMTPVTGGAAATSPCPGIPYTVAVDYGSSSKRRTYLTATVGSFATAPDKKCPGATVSAGKSTNVFTDTLTLPCDATGSLKLVATSAARATDFFHESSTTLPIASIAKCPGSSCPGAPPADSATAAAAAAAAASNKAPAAANDSKTPAATSAAPAAAAAAPAAAGGGGGCPTSAFGYSCSVAAGDGAFLHFTQGGVDPPVNPCTAASPAANRLAAADIPAGVQPVHVLLQAPVGGYAGVGFPQTKGVMTPADAVIGFVDGATGQPVVSAYSLTDYQPMPSGTNFDGRGWAYNMGAAKSGGQSLVCFTRLSNDPQAQYSQQLHNQGVDINWAGNDVNDFTTHSLVGSLTVDVADGRSVGNVLVIKSDDPSRYAGTAAHGALMLLAFVVFMPLGGLMARHKWVFGDKKNGGLRAAWFKLHRACQVLVVLLALAGFILGLVLFNVSWSLSDPIPHPLYDVHRFVGVVVMAFVLLQAASGFARPGLNARFRPPWRLGHLALGWTSMALGIVVVFIGVKIMHDLKGRSWVEWLLPVVLLLGLLLAAAAVGEIIKAKLQRQGRYRPKTHKYDSGALQPITGGHTFAGAAAAAGAAPAGTAADLNKHHGTAAAGSPSGSSDSHNNGGVNGASTAQLLSTSPDHQV